MTLALTIAICLFGSGVRVVNVIPPALLRGIFSWGDESGLHSPGSDLRLVLLSVPTKRSSPDRNKSNARLGLGRF